MEISLASLGSSQTFRSPQLSTEAASLFCNLRATMAARRYATLASLKRASQARMRRIGCRVPLSGPKTLALFEDESCNTSRDQFIHQTTSPNLPEMMVRLARSF